MTLSIRAGLAPVSHDERLAPPEGRKFSYAKIWSGKIGKVTPVRSFSPAVEDYLKAIYRLQGEAGDDPVSTDALGGWLGQASGAG